MKFLTSPADIVIGGGAAFAGKSVALLIDAARHVEVPGYGAIIFRTSYPQIMMQGGLWDESMNLYPFIGGAPIQSKTQWAFEGGKSKITFGHLSHESELINFQGSQIPFIGFDELTHFCITPDADVMTESGWKNITKLKAGEQVASLNAQEQIEYKEVKSLYSFDYTGKLKCVNQKHGVSFRVTPNHKCMVMRQLKNSEKQKGKSRYNGWRFVEAKDLKGCYIPRSGKFIGKEIEYDFLIDKPKYRGHGRNSNSVERIKPDAWIRFLGWYLSEGSCFASKNRTRSKIISIRQTGMKHSNEITDMLNDLGFRWRYRKDGNYLIFSRQLFDLLKPLGNRYQKRIPEWLFKSSSRQQKIFWDAFVKGDGHITKSGGVAIGLCNEGLIDDLQRLSFHIGMIATKGYGITKSGFDVWRITAGTRNKYNIIRKADWFEQHYTGKVYCPEVSDNHNFYIRVNGRCSWTGNSFKMFMYMLSRNRSTCGIRPVIRGTCNPDPDSWLADFLSWWIDPETGFPIQERAGKIRFFTVRQNVIVWGDTKGEVIMKLGDAFFPELPQEEREEKIKSITFIPGTIADNPIGTQKDPNYLANLLAQDEETQLRLLQGNWRIRVDKLSLFEFVSINDIFTNVIPENREDKYWITCDHARFGRDVCVIATWKGWKCIRMDLLLKSDTNDIVRVIQRLRQIYRNIPSSQILVDQDGIGVKDSIQCRVFHGGGTAIKVRRKIGLPNSEVQPYYKNLRTQCYYYLAEDKVNQSGISIDLKNIHLWNGVTSLQVESLKLKGREFTIRDLIRDDLRTIRRESPDHEGRKMIISKELQKESLAGRSPDFGDTLMMRAYLDFVNQPIFLTRA